MDENKIHDMKIFLKRYRKNRLLVNRLERKLLSIEDRLRIGSPVISDMPKGTSHVTSADLIADKVDIEKRIRRLNAKGQKIKDEVIDEIDTLEDVKQAEVLEAFMVDCKSIDDIAEDEGYSVRHTYRLYQCAIEELCKS